MLKDAVLNYNKKTEGCCLTLQVAWYRNCVKFFTLL